MRTKNQSLLLRSIIFVLLFINSYLVICQSTDSGSAIKIPENSSQSFAHVDSSILFVLKVGRRQIETYQTAGTQVLGKFDAEWIKSVDIISDPPEMQLYSKRKLEGVVLVQLTKKSWRKMPRKLRQSFRKSQKIEQEPST